MLSWNRTNVIQEPGMEFVVPRGYLRSGCRIAYRSKRSSSSLLSSDYVLSAGNTPLHSYCDLSIGVRHHLEADSSKYYIVQKLGKRRASMGGKYEHGWVKARVRNFGTFAVAVDTLAPRISPIGLKNGRANRNIRFKIGDAKNLCSPHIKYILTDISCFSA